LEIIDSSIKVKFTFSDKATTFNISIAGQQRVVVIGDHTNITNDYSHGAREDGRPISGTGKN
jgi:hypothetical protein